jgi:proteasome lid subunit RPN8/RPN11
VTPYPEESYEKGHGMTIHLKPEQKQVIGQAIRAGLIETVDDIVEVGVETIRQRLEAGAASEAPLSAEQWLQEFHAWVHSHPTTTPLLSDEAVSRESVYGTRGQ